MSYGGDPTTADPNAGGLRTFTRIIRRRALLIFLALVIVPAATMAVTLSKEKQYTTSASLLIRDSGTDTLFSDSEVLPGSPDEEREAATQADLANLTPVAVETARRIGGGVTAGEVAQAVTIRTSASSNLVTIEATHTEPELARRIANTYAAEFIDFQAENVQRKLRTIERRLDAELTEIRRDIVRVTREQEGASPSELAQLRAELRSLRQDRAEILQRRGELRSTAAVDIGNLELVSRADTPGSPSSPKPVRNLVFGIGLGLILGIALAALFEVLDRRIKEPEDAEEIFGRPVVGAIPESRSLAKADAVTSALGPGDKEAFRMLRATLHYFNVARPIRSVLITSPAPGEGKTTVAWNLAAASASAGVRTLLIEGELRKPSFTRKFNIQGDVGLTDFLAKGVDIDQCIYQLPLGDGRNGTMAAATLDVIPAGDIPPNPSDLIESDRMAWLIEAMEYRYDFVVIDAAPASVVSDAIPIVRRVSGVLAVVRMGKTTRDGARHLADRLDHLGAPVLGVVLNSITNKDGFYGAAYGYAAHYGKQRQDKAPVA